MLIYPLRNTCTNMNLTVGRSTQRWHVYRPQLVARTITANSHPDSLALLSTSSLFTQCQPRPKEYPVELEGQYRGREHVCQAIPLKERNV
jgi:hypothetical protein